MRRHSCTFLVPTKFSPPPNTQICLTTTLSFTLISTSARALLLSLGNNIVHSGAHFLDSLLGVFGAKDGSTSDKDVGAGLGALTSITRSNTTIDLDVLPRESLPQFLDLFEAFGHELLTTSARADGHDEQEIGSLTERVGDGASWGFR